MRALARVISIENTDRAGREMLAIGADKTGVDIMSPKALFRAVKLKNVPVTAANVLKQDMLSAGGEAATSYGTIDHSDRQTDMILFATLSQYSRLFEKLAKQQFGLPALADEIKASLRRHEGVPAPVLGMAFGAKTFVMGILNSTPDSFSDGGKYFSAEEALPHAAQMISQGADIIDVGGESTRPAAVYGEPSEIPDSEEIKRVVPVIEKIKGEFPGSVISVDTRKSSVASAALKAGASIVNDVSGLCFDPKMPEVLAPSKAAVIIMHSKGDPKTMQDDPRYDDIMSEILLFFEDRIRYACNAGIKEDNIVIDPGIGFGKTTEHNLEILKRLEELRCLGRPVCLGTSRKSFIGNILGIKDPAQRDGATAATISLAISKKVDIIRVHNVQIARQTADISDKIAKEGA